MNFIGMVKPEYIFRPKQVFRRLFDHHYYREREYCEEGLPWGLKIRIRPNEEHGKILQTLGVIDLAVSEVIYRLADAGDLAVDVGANIDT